MKVIDIIWETDGEEVDLPEEVELPDNIDPDDEDEVNDYLSDAYGWLVISWSILYKYEVYNHNDEVIDATDDLEDAQISAEYENAKFILDTEENKIIWEK